MANDVIGILTQAEVYPPEMIHIYLLDSQVTIQICCKSESDTRHLFNYLAAGVAQGFVHLDFEVE